MVSVVPVANILDFSSEARRELESRTKRLEPYMRASVAIVPSRGFAASIVRGILTGLVRLSRAKLPTLVTGSTAEGLAWLSAQILVEDGELVPADDLRGAYDHVERVALGPRPGA